HVFLGHHDFDTHHRLEQNRLGLSASFLDTNGGADFERHFRRIHFVVVAIVDRDLHVHHGIAGQNAAFERLADTLFDGGYELPRNIATANFILELETLTVIRFDAQLYARVLAATAGLLLMGVVVFGFGAN